MSLNIRHAAPGDALECGRICYEAFKSIAEEHNFPPDFPNTEAAVEMLTRMTAHPGFYGAVAELDGTIAGSNFLDERNPISGVGPVSVDPRAQNHGVGGHLMRAVMERSADKGFAGIRLVQSGYHSRSLSLYSKLGFEVREHLSCMQGNAIGGSIEGCTVRAAVEADLDSCARLCMRVHGHNRTGELSDSTRGGNARVVERAGRISGYSTAIAIYGHAVAETNDDLQALIAASPSFDGPGVLIPSRNGALMRWCLGKGLRVVFSMTLMTVGLYNEPAGPHLPSVLY
ncbi:MAG: GNAT family N-acetyltransferase [Candidatus Binataceae bacterium]